MKRSGLWLAKGIRHKLWLTLGIMLFVVGSVFFFWLGGSEPPGDTPLSAGTAPAEPAGLVAYFPFDEESSVEQAGSLVGDPSWTQGKVGGAVAFDGDRDSIRLRDIKVNTDAGGHNTVAFWMKWDGRNNVMPFAWNEKFDVYLSGGFLGINTGESNILGVSSKGLANNWVHLAAVFPNAVPNPTNTKLYLNGVEQQISERLKPTKVMRKATPTAFLSGWGADGNYKFKGFLDEIRIYNRMLTKIEIQTIMTTASPGDK